MPFPDPLSNRSLHQETAIGTKIARNAAYGALRVLLIAPIPLLLVPFIIKHVGTKGLGIWAVFLAINGLTSLADLGFLGTLTKHIAEHFANRDYVQLNRVINAGLLIFLGVATLCVVWLNLCTAFLISTFFQQASLPVPQLQHAIRLLAVAIGFNLFAFPFASIAAGLQRLDFTNLLAALNLILIAVLAAVFLASGLGIIGLVYSIVAASGVNLLLYILAARLLLPQFKVSPSLIRLADIRALFSFSVQMYATQIAIVVHTHTEKFLLAHFVGLIAAGWYDIANDLATKMRNVPSLLLSPLLPAAAELQARGDQSRTSELYRRTHKYLAFLGVPIIMIVGLMAHRFVEIWLGPGFSAAAAALIVLTAVHFLNLTCAPGVFILVSKGVLRPGVRAAIVVVITNLVLSTVLILFYGFTGAVYGTGLSLLTATAYFIAMFHQETGYPMSILLTPYIKPVGLGLLLAFLTRQFLPIYELRWAGMVITGLAFSICYVIALLVLRYFDTFDLQTLERLLPIPKAIRRIARLA